jgi:hypothetical protein
VVYAERYQQLLAHIDREIAAARRVMNDGDLWEAMAHLDHAFKSTEEARQLLLNVSKTAFERVMKEKA